MKSRLGPLGIGIGIPGSAALVSAGWSPTRIADCDLWLRGDLGITLSSGKVSAWADQSGNGHDVTQGTGAAQPVVATPSDGNGHQAVHFDGAQLLSSANVDWTGQTECSVFVVYKKTDTGTHTEFVAKGTIAGTSGFMFQHRNNDSLAVVGDDGASYNQYESGAGTYPANAIPYLVSFTIDAAQVAASENSLWVQGFSQTLSALNSANLANIGANTAYNIGNSSSSLPLKGDVYEVIVYKRKLTTTERQQVELYLATRYNILTDQRPMTAPTQLTGNVLWLDASLGITTVDAAIVGNDLGSANWTPSSLSARTTHTITEDGAAGALHCVLMDPALSGLQANHLAHVKIGLPAATGNGRYAMFIVSSGADRIFIDCQTGTIQFADGTVTNAVYSGGILDFDVTPSGAGNFYVCTSDGSHSLTHDGNGARTVTLADNGSGKDITITQKNVSAWADQSGNGHHFTQSTAANRPLYSASVPELVFDGSNDTLGITWTLAQPFTVFSIAKPTQAAGYGTAIGIGASIYMGSPGATYANAGADVGPRTVTHNAWHVYGARFNGATSQLAIDGATNDGNAGAGGWTAPAIGDGTGGVFTGSEKANLVWSRALSNGERHVVEHYLGATYGITVS